MAVLNCQDERARSFGWSFPTGPSRLHRLVDVCAGFQQSANNLGVPLARGEEEWGKAGIGKRRSEICARFEQQLDDWSMAFRRRPHGRRLSAFFFGVNLCT